MKRSKPRIADHEPHNRKHLRPRQFLRLRAQGYGGSTGTIGWDTGAAVESANRGAQESPQCWPRELLNSATTRGRPERARGHSGARRALVLLCSRAEQGLGNNIAALNYARQGSTWTRRTSLYGSFCTGSSTRARAIRPPAVATACRI